MTDEPRRRPDWDTTVTNIAEQHPGLNDTNWPNLVGHHLDTEDILADIIRDIIKIDVAPSQRGIRVMPPHEVGLNRLNDLRTNGCTNQPFHVAFNALAGGRSRRHLATKTGIAATRIHRLLTADIRPTIDDMNRVAAAFGKTGVYFMEWRAQMIAAAVGAFLEDNPERSVPLAKKMITVAQGRHR